MKQNWNKFESGLLVKMLPVENPLNQCGIICELTRRGLHSSSCRDAIRSLRDNTAVFWNNYLVSDFANAALDLMGWDDYNGERDEVKALISARLAFD